MVGTFFLSGERATSSAEAAYSRRKVDLIELALRQFLDRPEQQDDNHVFAHRCGGQAEVATWCNLSYVALWAKMTNLGFSAMAAI